MPNVSWQEPQVLVDLLAINLLAEEHGMSVPGERRVSMISPWFSEVELFLRPGPWHRTLKIERSAATYSLYRILLRFLARGWTVEVAVLAYGTSPSGLHKEPSDHRREVEVLQRLHADGAAIYLVPDLHAKGVVTPLGIVTGSTNITRSGLFLQAQNANYFAHDNPEYPSNRAQLLSRFADCPRASSVP